MVVEAELGKEAESGDPSMVEVRGWWAGRGRSRGGDGYERLVLAPP